MSLPFTPAAGKHAIDTCTVVVRFAQPADPQTFAAISQAAKLIADDNDLPASQQIVFPPMLMGVGGFQPGVGMGIVFQRFAKNGQVETELKCEPMAITLQVRTYDGWAALSVFIEKTILPLVPLYVSNLPAISGVTIQYDDRFLAGPGETPAAGALFRPGTKWVTLYDPATIQAWHSHFGIFLSDAPEKRELINVNVTVNDQPNPAGQTQRTVGLTILVGEAYDVPGQQPLIVEASEAANAISSLLEQSHSRHRLILQEVLADPYLEAIGAKAN